MTRPKQTLQSITLPAPTRGMIDEAENASPMEGYARFLRNWVIRPRHIHERYTQTDPGDAPTTTQSATLLWGSVADDAYLYDDGKIYDGSGSTLLASSNLQDPTVQEFRFKDEIFLFNFSINDNVLHYVNATTTWGTLNFTLANLAGTEVRGVTGYKGRLYMYGNDVTVPTIEYGGIGAVTGNTTAYTIQEFLQGGELLLHCEPVVMELGIDTEEVFVIWGDKGTVLVAVGSTPETWSLDARWTMGEPRSHHSFVNIEGDVLVATKEYIYSSRELFSSGSRAAKTNTITDSLKVWYQLYARKAEDDLTLGYWPELDAILIMGADAEDFMNSDDFEFTGSQGTDWRFAQLVYFRETQAWAFWDVPQLHGVFQLVKHSGGTYIRWPHYDRLLELDTRNAFGADLIIDTDQITPPSTTPAVEVVWESTFLPMKNIEFKGCKPTFRQSQVIESGGVDIEQNLAAVGAIADGMTFRRTDFNLARETWVRPDDDSSSTIAYSNTLSNGSGVNIPIQRPFLDVNLQAEVVSFYLRVRDIDDSDSDDDGDYPGYTQLWDVEIFFEPSGVLS